MDTTGGTANTGDSPVTTAGDIPRPINLSSRSRSPTPPPTDSLSSLHRVTDMLKDKLNGKKDFLDNSDRDSGHSRKSPYHQQSTSAAERKNGCVPSAMDSPYPTLPPHHMSMLLGNDVYGHNADSANVLRGILQGKEMMEADVDKHLRTSRRFSELYGHEDGKKARGTTGDSDAESYRSGSPGNMSFDDSDPERQINGVSDLDEIVGDAGKASINGDNEDSFMDGQLENGTDDEESLDVKKSHSDSMHSNILPSGKASSTDGLLTPPERRPKRKQYIPQQHGSLEPTNKLRKVEKEVLQTQLKQMQKQLIVMQQRYRELFDQGEVPDLPGLEGTEDDASKCKNSEKHRFIGSLDFDPSHFIKQANKLVQEQEMLSKNSDGSSNILAGKSPSDMQNLARMLKDELANSVNSLVDTVVAKFVEKHEKLPSPRSSAVPPVVFKPKKEQTPTPASETETPKPKCPTPTGALNNNNNNNNNNEMKGLSIPSSKYFPSSHSFSHHSHDTNGLPKPPRTKVTDKIGHPFFDFHPKPFSELARAHPALFPPPPYFPTQIPPIQPLYAKEPEQTEPMSLVLGTPGKKKRTKVTDTRLSPRAARALLQESLPISSPYDSHKHAAHMLGFGDYGHPMIPMSLPTSVAIPNPSLQHSDILAMYSSMDHSQYVGESSRRGHSPSISPSMGHTPGESFHSLKDMDSYEQMMSDNYNYEGNHAMTTTLTPMHLRKAKLMFFYSRYPSSSILKIYFPDIKFNKNNTAQLVKWFSNFREFFYIQMEKYSRQALAEGVKNPEELSVTNESELYRILNLHYNRNNQIDVPDNFRGVVQSTLREFFRAVQGGKDTEQSWKKAIYKVIARMDDTLPEYFKSPNWMEQLNDA